MIIRTKERIDQTAEVFTPPALVNEMLDKIPTEVWADPTKTVLDNSCGNGNFLVEVLRRKIQHGSTPTQALETIYGVELMADNVAECKARLLAIAGDTEAHRDIVDRNIVCHDALTWNYWVPDMWD